MSRPYLVQTFFPRSKAGSAARSALSGIVLDKGRIQHYEAVESNALFLGMPFVIFENNAGQNTEDQLMHGRGTEPGENNKARRAAAQRAAAQAAAQMIAGSPIVLLTTAEVAPDIDTAPHFWFGDLAWRGDNFRAAKRRQAAILQAGMQTTFPVPPFIIPASAYNVLSCDMLSEIQRHMLESTIDEGATWSLWTQTEVLAFLNQRIDRFMLESGLVQTLASITTTAGNNEYEYPSDTIDVRRVAFYAGSTYTPLERLDPLQADNGFPSWESASPTTPFAVIEQPKPSLTFQLCPVPATAGTVLVLYVQDPPLITTECSILPIPDLFTPFVKWGVIADMLNKEGEANDPVRAQVAESRFELGVVLAKLMVGGPSGVT